MRKAFALLLIFVFGLQSAVAGIDSQKARFVGGTSSLIPLDAVGSLNARDEVQLNFAYKAARNKELGKYPEGTFSVPYARITRLTYGEVKHLRIGQTIALAALAGVGGLLLLLSKSRTHFLSIEYKDAQDKAQLLDFEVGKEAIRPLLASLELRTGKKTEYEVGTRAAATATP